MLRRCLNTPLVCNRACNESRTSSSTSSAFSMTYSNLLSSAMNAFGNTVVPVRNGRKKNVTSFKTTKSWPFSTARVSTKLLLSIAFGTAIVCPRQKRLSTRMSSPEDQIPPIFGNSKKRLGHHRVDPSCYWSHVPRTQRWRQCIPSAFAHVDCPCQAPLAHCETGMEYHDPKEPVPHTDLKWMGCWSNLLV